MADGQERPHRRGPRQGRRARPGPAGLHGVPRPPVRLLHARDDDDRARAARREPEPDRGRDPRGRSPATSAAAPATRTSSPRSSGPPSNPAADATRGDRMTAVEDAPAPQRRRQPHRLRPHAPQGGRRASSAARATTSTTCSCPGMLLRRDPAQPVRPRADPLHRHLGRRGAARREGRHHRRGARDARPRLDADALLRHPGRARHRQGALPGPGGRVRRRRDRVHRAATRSSSSTSSTSRCPRSSTRKKALDPDAPVIRDDKEGKTDNHIYDWEAGDKDADRRAPSPTPTSSSPRTSSTRACTRRRWRRAARSPHMDPVTGKLTLWTTTQAPHAHRTVYALVAGLPEHKIQVISPGHRRRLRQQGADLPRLRLLDRRLHRHRQAGEVDGGPQPRTSCRPASPATTT